MKTRVVVAMSGGVDSSVAALLLTQQGYEVVGVTMCFNLPDAVTKKPTCCGLQGIDDARRVAHVLGVRHYVFNMQKVLQEKVIEDFVHEYAEGRTPNPCVRCNQYIKFDALLKKAHALDAQFLATGHFARIARDRHFKSRSLFLLQKAKDLKKDQSYFLYRLGQRQLRHILFPLSEYTKEEVRQLARQAGLPVAEKIASQEICFLPEGDYRIFLQRCLQGKILPGPIVDTKGNLLGTHRGIAFYTIGQREGLGIARGFPVYVTAIHAKKNEIVVGSAEEAAKRAFVVTQVHFVASALKKKVAAKVRIRYNHKEMPAEVIPISEGLEIRFKRPQFAVTPGQSSVFYDGDTVLGGGIIV
ncbi:MAG: tRNA 2-thiouridine(34) synthase MnmA [Candidatus Omnitrophica bacterium]|nr:tRNA 2-thiouridine(34) synthase MnmA [Candidatus Omnitrophota bacterium]